MRVGDVIQAEHDGEMGTGIVTAIRDGRAFVRLTICSGQPSISPLTGGGRRAAGGSTCCGLPVAGSYRPADLRVWFAFELAIEIGRSIRQHPTGSATRPGGVTAAARVLAETLVDHQMHVVNGNWFKTSVSSAAVTSSLPC